MTHPENLIIVNFIELKYLQHYKWYLVLSNFMRNHLDDRESEMGW